MSFLDRMRDHSRSPAPDAVDAMDGIEVDGAVDVTEARPEDRGALR